MFLTRTISGFVLLSLMITIFILGGYPLAAVILIFSLLAYRELTKALGCATYEKKLNALEIIGMSGILVYYIGMVVSQNTGDGSDSLVLLLIIITTFMAEMFAYVIKFPKYNISQVMAAIFAFVYAPVMLAFIYLTRESTYGVYAVWIILISSWGCDTFAYLTGMITGKTCGNHKIFPILSPKKSLEGCIGGVAAAIIIGAIYGHFGMGSLYPDKNMAVVVGFICGVSAIFSMCGDLAASGIKRNHNVKDYGKIIPGHGGIMDRYDSVIVTAPMTYLLLMIFLHR